MNLIWINKTNLWRHFLSDRSWIRLAGERRQWCTRKKYYRILLRMHFDRSEATVWTTLFLTRFTGICFGNCPLASKASQEISKEHFKMYLRLFWKAASTLVCWNSVFYCPSSQTVLQHGQREKLSNVRKRDQILHRQGKEQKMENVQVNNALMRC